MKDKNKIKILLLSLCAVFITIASGIAYAFFIAGLSGQEATSTVSADSGYMTLEYIPTNSAGTTITVAENYISAGKISPSPSPFATKYFKVKGTNTTNKPMSYKITLVIDENGFSDGAIQYTLTSTNTSGIGVIVPSVETKTSISGTTPVDIGSGSFPNGSNMYHSYYIKFYFPDSATTDQSADMGKIFKAHIEVIGQKAS